MGKSREVMRKIQSIPEGKTFRYQDLGLPADAYSSTAKLLERLVSKGLLKRVTRGTFYRPQSSPFGELMPREAELLKPYLFDRGRRIGYVTGSSLYNGMGLTTQVPKTIQVASRGRRVSTQVGSLCLRPAKSYVEVTDQNYSLLEILDAIKDFKNISDLNPATAITILREKVLTLPPTDFSKLMRIALKYPPRVRALLGAMLEPLKGVQVVQPLRDSLNPLSAYALGISAQILPTAPQWNIE